jgi:hypothetical protein
MRSQELVFRETAEQLIVEKEAFVREEVVLSRLVKEQVQDIHDRVKRTEVEVERISPQEAQQIAERPLPEAKPIPSPGEARPVPSLEQARPVPSLEQARPAPSLEQARPAPSLEEARPAPSAGETRPSLSAGEARPVARKSSPAVRTSRNSKTWWAWFALMVIAAVLTAFALGQFLGSSSPA